MALPSGLSGHHDAAEGASALVPTAPPMAEAVVVGTPPGHGGCHHLDEEDGRPRLPQEEARDSPTGPRAGASSSGMGQRSSSDDAGAPGSHSKQAASRDAAAAGGGCDGDGGGIADFSAMVLSPADGSSYMR